MTAVSAPPGYLSGFCASGRHERCRGDFGSAVCCCPHHTEPAPEPEPEPEPVALHHCPTCTCRAVRAP